MKTSDKYEWGGFSSHWTFYELRRNENKGTVYKAEHKFHISIDQKKIYEAQPLVLEILSRHSIQHFKVLKKNTNLRNAMGKELVVYIQKDFNNINDDNYEASADFWSTVLNEIETVLAEAKILPNQTFHPQGDKLLAGSKGYIYYRYATNVFGYYVEADRLCMHGFTGHEAHNLSGKTDFEDWLQKIKLNNPTSIAQVQKDLSSTSRIDILQNVVCNEEDKKHIRKTLMSTIMSGIDEICFTGDNKTRFDNGSHPEDEIKKVKNIFTQLRGAYYLDDIEKRDLSTKILYECIDKAAEYTTLIRQTLNMATNFRTTFGNITPVVYHQFILPIAQVVLQSQPYEVDKLIDKQKFIRSLVKCAFRDEKIEQINFDEPQYVSPVNEYTLNSLLDKLMEPEVGITRSLSSTALMALNGLTITPLSNSNATLQGNAYVSENPPSQVTTSVMPVLDSEEPELSPGMKL